jgi:hypothetical protein
MSVTENARIQMKQSHDIYIEALYRLQGKQSNLMKSWWLSIASGSGRGYRYWRSIYEQQTYNACTISSISRTKIVEKQVTSDRSDADIEDATKNGRLGTARNNVVIETIQERNRKLHLALGAAYPNVCFIQPSKHGD